MVLFKAGEIITKKGEVANDGLLFEGHGENYTTAVPLDRARSLEMGGILVLFGLPEPGPSCCFGQLLFVVHSEEESNTKLGIYSVGTSFSLGSKWPYYIVIPLLHSNMHGAKTMMQLVNASHKQQCTMLPVIHCPFFPFMAPQNRGSRAVSWVTFNLWANKRPIVFSPVNYHSNFSSRK